MIKRLLSVILTLSFCCLAHAQEDDFTYLKKKKQFVQAAAGTPVPTLVQYVVQSNSRSTASNNATAITAGDKEHECFPNTTLASNLIAVAWSVAPASATTPTVVIGDDKSNTYSSAVFFNDVTNTTWTGVNYVAGAGAGVLCLSFTVSNVNFGDVVFDIFEFNNVATITPVDVTCGADANTGTVACGPVTPVSGDLFLQFAWDDFAIAATTWTVGSQSNITWKLLQADTLDGSGVQFGVYNSTTAISPTFTKGTAGFATAFVAFKAANAGTPRPAGQRIIGVNHTAMPSGTYSSPRTLDIPTLGTSFLVSWIAGCGTAPFIDITAVSDSKSNTYTSTGAEVSVSGHSCAHNWRSLGATPDTNMTVTVTRPNGGNAPNDETILFYDMQGGTTFDSAAEITGTGTAAGSSLTGSVSLTPSVANGIAFFTLGVDATSISSITAGCVLDDAWVDRENVAIAPLDFNNGWAHCSHTSTSAISANWTGVPAGTAIGSWSSRGTNIEQ